MIKRRLTIAAAAALFFVLAGTGVASALWSTPASVSSTVKVANLADDCSTTAVSMLNASFEDPAQASGVSNVSGNGGLTGWRAKKNSDNSVTNIEVWTSGTQYDNRPPVIAPVGNQFVELNANEAGTLYQDVDTLTDGQMLQWSFLHRGRMGEDTMQLLIGAPGALVLQGQFKTGNDVTNGNNGWVRYSGTYVVPANQDKTQLAFKALTTASGDTTIGNFLDDVSFGSSPCVKASSVVSNASPYVNQTIRYTTTVASSGGTPSSSTALTWDIPSGLTYVANSLKVNNAVVASATVTGTRISAGLGVGASSTAGGSLARGVTATVVFDVVVNAAAPTKFVYTPTVTYTNGLAASWTRSVVAADVPVTVISDTQKPSAPATQTRLTWAASSDNIGVVGYDVYRGATVVGSTNGTTTTFTATGLVAWSSNVYTIRARDAAGNVSDASGSRTVIASPTGLNTTSSFKIFRSPQGEEYCLGASTANTALGISTTCTSNALRNWFFVPSTDGYAKITIATNPVRYWTAGNGTGVTVVGLTNTTTQDWLVKEAADGYTFESRSRPGFCLERTATTTVALNECDTSTAPQVFDATAR
jgi:uncharacterized repeat protein (TIGR01451 family)